MIDGRNFFDQPVKNNLRTYDNNRKITVGQRDNYTTGCLLNYPNFKNYCKMIATDLSKLQELHANPKQYSKSTRSNLDQPGSTTMFFIIEETKETILDFSQGTVNVL